LNTIKESEAAAQVEVKRLQALVESKDEESLGFKNEIESLKAQLDQVRRDNQKVLKTLINMVGGKEKLIALRNGQQPSDDDRTDEDEEVKEEDKATDPHEGKGAIISIPETTVSTQPIENLQHPSSKKLGVEAVPQFQAYTRKLGQRVDHLRDALNQAKNREQKYSNLLRSSHATSAYDYLYKT